MISTRQLIFIINMVFFFVNPATSGDRGSSSTSRFSFFRKKKNESYAGTSSTENEEKNNEHLDSCKFELSSAAFQPEDRYDNFVHAFLYLKKAEFEDKIYTPATAAYYYDLLRAARKMYKPHILNPNDYCNQYFANDGFLYSHENCLHEIAKLGCGAYFAEFVCVEHLYLTLNIDELLACYNINPKYEPGTEHISDKDLTEAVNKGMQWYSGSSEDQLLKCLSDKRITREHYRMKITNIIPRYDFYQFNATNEELTFYEQARKHPRFDDYARSHYRDDPDEEFVMTSKSGPIPINETFIRRCTLRDQSGHKVEVKEYLKDARERFYGIRDLPYKTLHSEYTRRQNLRKNYSYQFVMYLLQQLQQGIKSEFKNCEESCLTYLENNPTYYTYYGE